LFNIDINCKLIKWIAVFLHDRKMRVKDRLKLSDWVAVLSGVSHGSVLSSLLFLIFVNDLPLLICNNMIVMFSDNTKISRKITGVKDGFLLQEDLDYLMEWTEVLAFKLQYWEVQDNANSAQMSDCVWIEWERVTRSRRRERFWELLLQMIWSHLFSVQPAKAAAKAMQELKVIKRNFVLTDEGNFRLLFNT